jgi:hypothetical protein
VLCFELPGLRPVFLPAGYLNVKVQPSQNSNLYFPGKAAMTTHYSAIIQKTEKTSNYPAYIIRFCDQFLTLDRMTIPHFLDAIRTANDCIDFTLLHWIAGSL